MNKIRLIVAIIFSFRLLPHIIFYFLGNNKYIIRSDVNGFVDFVYRLTWDVTYRNLFYHRVGRIHFLFSWLVPRCSYTKISQNMILGKNCKLIHSFCTFLNGRSIGDGLICYQNVTVGALGGDDKIPTIGNNVVLSCGCSVLGNITIGNNVIIGSGCVVVKDIPNNCTVIGNPSRIVKMNGKKLSNE